MRPLMALGLLALLTASLAGCADDKERYPDGVPPQSSTAPTTANGGTTAPAATSTSSSTTTGGPANQAPTGSVSVSINGTNATFTLTGSDPDGDAIVWDLDFGDGGAGANGTILPATVNHTYAAGNFSANFTVSDGLSPVTYSAPVVISVGGGGGAGPVQVITVGWQAGGSDLAALPEILMCTAGPGDGVTHGTFTVEPQSFGVPFVATITDASGGAAIAGWGMIISDPGCGAEDFESYGVEGAGPITGIVPDGYSFGLVTSDGGAMPEVTITFG